MRDMLESIRNNNNIRICKPISSLDLLYVHGLRVSSRLHACSLADDTLLLYPVHKYIDGIFIRLALDLLQCFNCFFPVSWVMMGPFKANLISTTR